MHTFGASAPLKELQKNFGFVSGHVVAVAKELLDPGRISASTA
jgi:transketolase